MGNPVRTCVTCRRRLPQPALVRLALARQASVGGHSDVVVDAERRQPGRGAYLCPRRSCLEAALRRDGRRLVRALRRHPGQVTVDPDAIRAGWSAAAGDDSDEPETQRRGENERLGPRGVAE